MPDASETLLDAQRTLLETSQLLGMKGLEAGVKLFDLNMRTLRDLRDTAAVPGNGTGAALELAGPSGYLQQLSELCTSTGSEIARLLQRQAEGLQALFGALFLMGGRLPEAMAVAQRPGGSA